MDNYHFIMAICFGSFVLGIVVVWLGKILEALGQDPDWEGCCGCIGVLLVFGSIICLIGNWIYMQISTNDAHVVVGFIGACFIGIIYAAVICVGISVVFAALGKILK